MALISGIGALLGGEVHGEGRVISDGRSGQRRSLDGQASDLVLDVCRRIKVDGVETLGQRTDQAKQECVFSDWEAPGLGEQAYLRQVWR